MTSEPNDKPHYTRYRAGRRIPGRQESDIQDVRLPRSPRRPRKPGDPAPSTRGGWGERITAKRILLGVGVFILGWLALSLVLFLLSAHFERTSPHRMSRAC